MHIFGLLLSFFLILLFPTCAPLAQPLPPQSLTTPGQLTTSIPYGDYLFVYRTRAHIKFSSLTVFEQVKIYPIAEYLAAQHVDIVKVEELDFSALTEENLEITEIADLPDILAEGSSSSSRL